MSKSFEDLIRRIRDEARRDEIPVDRSAYERIGKDPFDPILCGGPLDARVAMFGRDLGKDEIKYGEPFIGAGGRLVREGVIRAWEDPNLPERAGRARLEAALRYVLFSNTVPYKPPGNKAYSEAVKERFRPYVLQLLMCFWSGHNIITLGNEAFHWFKPYSHAEELRAYGQSDERFSRVFHCHLKPAEDAPGQIRSKDVNVFPLPHPSPLNRRWRSRFPAMLADRLAEARAAV